MKTHHQFWLFFLLFIRFIIAIQLFVAFWIVFVCKRAIISCVALDTDFGSNRVEFCVWNFVCWNWCRIVAELGKFWNWSIWYFGASTRLTELCEILSTYDYVVFCCFEWRGLGFLRKQKMIEIYRETGKEKERERDCFWVNEKFPGVRAGSLSFQSLLFLWNEWMTEKVKF